MNDKTRKFLSYYKRHRGILIADLVCAAAVAAIAVALPLCVRAVTKDALALGLDAMPGRALSIGGLMAVLIAIQTLCGYFVDARGHAMGAAMEADLRADLFAHLMRQEFGFFDRRSTGELMGRISNDLLQLTELYHHGPEDYMIYTVKFLGALIVLWGIDWRLTLVIFAFLPPLALWVLVFGRRMNRALRRTMESVGGVNAQVEDALSGVRTVQSFANEPLEQQRFDVENQRFLHSRVAGYRSEAWLGQGVEFVTAMITVAVVVFGAVSVSRAQLDLADLLTFLLYTGSLVEPVRRLAHMTEQFQQGVAGFGRFWELLQRQPQVADRPGAVAPAVVRGDIRFDDVSFGYYEDHDAVLRGLSLDIRAGERVALVGPSGVGKTTLCALIARYYEPQQGAVRVDGVDVRDWPLRALRRAVGVVQQDTHLFEGTVLDNIRYGRPDASRQQIVEAAIAAGADGFIRGLPQGYDTPVGQRGVRLSGGQRQRVSIARVFLKDPAVLIFDEATSALDEHSEQAVQRSLDILSRGRTTIIIAHRLSTIRQSGRIVVLAEQGILEQGGHEELLGRGGAYAALYRAQAGLDEVRKL